MFGIGKKKSGAANLAALFNNMGASGGVENFANMLNNMGESGGHKLGRLFGQLTTRGTENYSAFLNHASAEESRQFTEWLERADEAEVTAICGFLNDTRLRPAMIADRLAQFVSIRLPNMAAPSYDEVKVAIVQNRLADVVDCLDRGFDVHSRNSFDEVVLLNAVCMGDARLEITRLLIDRGADVNAIVGGTSILERLQRPEYCDNEQTIELLLQQGAVVRTTPAVPDDRLMRFLCPTCGKRLKAPQEQAGRRCRCNKCGARMVIPEPATPVPADPLAVYLKNLHHDDDFDVRIEAMSGLRLSKSPDAVAPLIELLRDADDRVRQEAAYCLECLGDRRAVDPLIANLYDLEGDVRLKAARALGVLGDARAIDPLCRSLRDPDEGVRFYVAQALGELKAVSALDALRAAFDEAEGDSLQRMLRETIARLQPAPPPRPELPPLTGRAAAKRLNDMANSDDTAENERHLRAAIAADPTFDIPYCNLGHLLFQKGNYEEAREMLRNAVRLGKPGTHAYDQSFRMLAMIGAY